MNLLQFIGATADGTQIYIREGEDGKLSEVQTLTPDMCIIVMPVYHTSAKVVKSWVNRSQLDKVIMIETFEAIANPKATIIVKGKAKHQREAAKEAAGILTMML